MSRKSSLQFLRRLLTWWLEKLDTIDKKTPRSRKIPWTQIEYHVPPIVVAVISAFLLYGVLCWGADFNIYQYSAMGLFVVLLTILFGLYLIRDHPDLAKSDDAISLLSVLFFTTVLWIKLVSIYASQFTPVSPYATPVAIGPLLAALLLHPRLALILSGILSLIFGVVNGFSLEFTLVGSFGCVTMVAAVYRARTTQHVVRAGIFAGLVQILMILIIAIMKGWDHQLTLVSMVSVGASGFLAAFFSLGALPYLEGFFSMTSNLRLLELADVNHPLLRRLSLEAPGTYHHSMIVANLAAEAATAIGANGLLSRVGAYYHDIGKIVKAEYFIENQGALGNPHDQVSPSLSKLIITSHVKEGIALGKEYRLEEPVLNFIPQHHGTSPIEYFYQKALKLEEAEDEVDKEEIKEETYRYPGPKPQSREAGIVMLADSVEAASRTLEEPNHERYKDLVYKIINKKLFDHQLNETPLTLKDLHRVAKQFVATLTSINHARIPYPETEIKEPRKTKEKLTPPRRENS